MNLSFLLGLDWTIPQALQLVREGLNHVEALKQASKTDGILNRVMGDADEILRELAISEDQAKRLSAQLAEFKVIPEYQALRAEVDQVARRQGEINDLLVSINSAIAEHEEALRLEGVQTPDLAALQRLYKEAMVVLPEAVTKRFDEVRSFHESVVRNRRSYLEDEMQALRSQCNQLEQEQTGLSIRYQEVMGVLKTGGALEQHERFQEELNRIQGRVEHLRHRHKTYEQVARQKAELEIERKQLSLRLSRDFEEQEEVIKRAMALFESYASALYTRPGTFTIHRTDNGPSFEAKIPGGGSAKGGISHMEVFCFDLMLTTLIHERGKGPGFLIHDSHLFDGVDARQVASALALGDKVARELGIQYIVTLNSDALPSIEDRPKNLDLEASVLTVRLKDTDETGGLFGFRFG